MIPKVIHYCWFGRNTLPELAQKCIMSWKKYCPDYEIKEWNEDNYDLNCCEYIMEAYKAHKWAFVSDYVRFDVLYRYGGIYFDTDVELIKPIDDIIDKGPFMGCEPICNKKKYRKIIRSRKHLDLGLVAPGLGMAADSGMNIYKEILDYYNQMHFMDAGGKINGITVVEHITNILEKYGFKLENKIQNIAGIYIYPCDYFCPIDYNTGKLYITNNTHSIHHYVASWKSETSKKVHRVSQFLFDKGIIGKVLAIILIPFLLIIYKIEEIGFVATIKFVIRKLKLANWS